MRAVEGRVNLAGRLCAGGVVIGWTTRSTPFRLDLTVSDSGRAVVALNSDEPGGEIAFLEGGGDWLLATSGSMC